MSMENITNKFDNAFGNVLGSFYETPHIKQPPKNDRKRLIPEPVPVKKEEIIQKNDVIVNKQAKNFLYYVKKLFNKRK